ncbi:MAG: alpha/beta hydrolase [Pseudomonadota bacterium]
MPIDRRSFLGTAAGVTLAGGAPARALGAVDDRYGHWPPAEYFPLWDDVPPGAPDPLPTPTISLDGYQGRELWLRGVARPVVGVFRAKNPDGRAVLSIPGGGYGFVSVSNEGLDVARVLNSLGITVFVLAYRLPGDGWANRADVPLADAQRAMRRIRADAGRYGIRADRLGVLGFSAGGHLAGMLATGHGDPTYTAQYKFDGDSARPDFAGLVYPVMSFKDAGLNSRSAAMLLGDDADPALIARYTPADRIAADTPPLFLAHAVDDPIVPIAQSLLTVERAHAAQVPVEAHLFARGGHGFGALHLPERAPGLLWPDLFDRWSGALFRG